ncbi:oxidoreductase [Plasmopara halstedii]|uniref:Oxidoreductase n=1 Tax=Plasmopara halstedii TaxID=4781 RepID=A0A0P1AH81_PLAHL|nr:oxidoreductase [Plasmopara halstedii]CEG40502.1 oxidoreductase [Plasmopara halstedii]|eukprot:XP_024576871.1 oxidoreductase [Plasmopara halstedii]
MSSLLCHTRHLALRHSSARTIATVASDRPFRVGIVGAGRIGQVHAQGIQRTSAVVHCIQIPARENLPHRAEKIAKKFEQIIEAAKHQKHIFCEKPVDLALNVVNKAIKATEDAGVKLMIGFQRRFDSNFLRIKQAIDRDEIGKVNMLRITSRDPGPPPVSYINSSGGLFRDMTIHDFDMARFLVGDEIEEVYTMAQCVNPDIAAAGDIDSAVVLLKFYNGVICYIENSREAAYGYDQRVEVLGSKGSVRCGNAYANQVVVSTNESVHRDLPVHFFLERYMDAYVAEMKEFIRVCTSNAPVSVGGDAGREALLLALAANKSLAENRPVKVDELRA